MQVCDTTLQVQVAKVCKVNFVFTPTIQTPVWSAVLLEMGRCVCVCVWPLVLDPGFASFNAAGEP